MADKEKKRRKRIDPQKLLAISALIISVFTACIYIYQATIMSKQHQDSVWPYVYSGISLNEEQGLTISLYNKGIGPALVQSVIISQKDKTFNSWSELLEYLKLKGIRFSCSGTAVLAASETQQIFQVADFEEASKLYKKLNAMDIKIIYCSIHEECWSLEANELKKVNLKKTKSIICG